MSGGQNFLGGDLSVSAAVRHYRRNREERVAYAKEYQAQVKAKAKRILSSDPPVCKHCGFDDERVLHIDHIHGGGRKERLHKSAQMIRDWIVKHPEEAREKYQLLCANCNFLKALVQKEYKRGPRCKQS